jgi:hypothetical protein
MVTSYISSKLGSGIVLFDKVFGYFKARFFVNGT